ncbi:motility protein A [Cellulomonas carbonis]|uniref:Flagellar motor protein MotA n=1 Tax=Cellulomonas carbonis T26 TaxID=947969 RepID=A0A0A0BP37_9CELL|nr:MotA/TolQ/ExbB proton channel family protein [Cellulomonas carbonis]KGM08849.1 flagellar motor protein MotA [Cellulomonas carbonis T26]MDT0165136.1 MotA/TolQ/ExbB proton channel family protein [Actinotalea sp. AC32]GGC01644.1 motility protein A [Cellulomonas carbonis]
MDPATLGGIALAFVMIFASILIEGADPMSVFLPAPMILVIGGTIGAGLASMTLKDTIRAFTTLPRWLTFKAPDSEATVETVVGLADRARREGLLSLEDAARSVDDPFLRDGLQAAIDGTDPDDLRDMLESKIASKRAQDKASAKFFNNMGGYAPTIGIIGTVVSLVHVLENLANPDELGHMIGAAFVATLWGLLTANLIWLPFAARITRASEIEAQHMEIAVEGLLAIQAGANPRLVGQRLRSLMPADAQKAA